MERMIKNMFQVGEISEVYDNQLPKLYEKNSLMAKVDLHGRVTDFFPVFTFSNGFKKSYTPLRVGEQVGVFCPFGNANIGFILRGIVENGTHPTGYGKDVEVVEYEDGTIFKIDLSSKKIELITPNSVELKAKDVKVVANSATIDSKNINLGVGGAGVVTNACVCAFTGNPHPQGSLSVKATI